MKPERWVKCPACWSDSVEVEVEDDGAKIRFTCQECGEREAYREPPNNG